MRDQHVSTKRNSKRGSRVSLAMTSLVLAINGIWSADVSAQSTKAQLSEEVVVTASRIQREGFTAPTPITSLGAEDVQARAATTIANILYDLPAARPAQTPLNTAFNSGGNFVNLRGLGNARSLVLVDGHRFVPTTQNGFVDTNVVPTALVQRIDVVTGGASAAWGSDAVAGVTNIVLKKNLEGVQGNVQYGRSQQGDNKETGASLAWGTSFAQDRGQVMIAGEYSKLKSALQGDRDWGRSHSGTDTNVPVNGVTYGTAVLTGLTLANVTSGGVIVSTVATGATAATNTLLANASDGSAVPNNASLPGVQFGTGGAAQAFNYGRYSNGSVMVGGDGGWVGDKLYLNTPLERKNLYARGTFDFTPNVRAFAEATYARSESETSPFPSAEPLAPGAGPINISRDNYYLNQTNPALVAQMVSKNIASFNMGRILTEIGAPLYLTNNTVKRVALGLDGNIGESWKWNTYYTHGETKYHFEIRNHIIEPNLRAAMDAVAGPGGSPICRINSTVASDITITSRTNYFGLGATPGCIAANPFGPNSLTSAVVNYITGTEIYEVKYKQDAGAISANGEIYKGWAGPVLGVAGLEYRKESLVSTSDAISQFKNTAYRAGAFQFSNPQPTSGSYNVREFFAETGVPIAKLETGQTLDVNAAARRTDYSTSGYVTSWKAGMTFKPIADLLLRATQSKDIRAASLNELYAAGIFGAGGVLSYTGPALNAASVQNPSSFNVQVGNPTLKPEKADTTVYGFTWTPAALKGFATSVDYYRIRLNDAIAAPTAQNIVNSCFGYQGFVVNTSNCQYISSSNGTFAPGTLTQVNVVNQNIGTVLNTGVDVEFNYRFQLSALASGAPGALTLRLLGTRSLESRTDSVFTLLASGPALNAIDTANNPKWRWTATANYQNGPLTLFVQGRYIDKTKAVNTLADTVYYDNVVPSRFYVNTSAQYVVYDKGGKRLSVYGNINNLFDKDPPLTAAGGYTQLAGPQGLYDLIGRAFTAGVRFSY